jgi:hypothetical protein
MPQIIDEPISYQLPQGVIRPKTGSSQGFEMIGRNIKEGDFAELFTRSGQ